MDVIYGKWSGCIATCWGERERTACQRGEDSTHLRTTDISLTLRLANLSSVKTVRNSHAIKKERERERMKDMGKREYFNISSSGTEMHYICSSNQTSLWLGNLKSCQKEKTAPFTRFIANMNSGNVWDCNIFLYWCLKIWFTDSTQYMHKYCAVWFTINLDWDILCINLSVCSVKKKNWHFME